MTECAVALTDDVLKHLRVEPGRNADLKDRSTGWIPAALQDLDREARDEAAKRELASLVGQLADAQSGCGPPTRGRYSSYSKRSTPPARTARSSMFSRE